MKTAPIIPYCLNHKKTRIKQIKGEKKKKTMTVSSAQFVSFEFDSFLNIYFPS